MASAPGGNTALRVELCPRDAAEVPPPARRCGGSIVDLELPGDGVVVDRCFLFFLEPIVASKHYLSILMGDARPLANHFHKVRIKMLK